MWLENKILKEDLEYIVSCDFIPFEKLRNKTILITGATGLIGQNLVNALIFANIKKQLNIKVLALVRNIEKANMLFSNQIKENKGLEFIIGDVRNFESPKCDIDYIIHGASITQSKDFVEKADEVKDISINGTKYLLDFAKQKNTKSFVYLSSMEVYGYPEKGHICKEDESYDFDINQPRNSYPIAKLECEKLCKESSISTKVVRLAQTFGLGITKDDNRFFAMVARCIKENKDIVLNTKGETERCYLYTADAVTAILTVLLNGKDKEIYNAANEDTYCSIKAVAEKAVKEIAKDKIKLLVNIKDNEKYPNPTYLDLDISKLRFLNWNYNINYMSSYNNYICKYISRMIESIYE